MSAIVSSTVSTVPSLTAFRSSSSVTRYLPTSLMVGRSDHWRQPIHGSHDVNPGSRRAARPDGRAAAARRRRGDDRSQGGALRPRAAPCARGTPREGQPPPAAWMGRAGRRGGALGGGRCDRRGAHGRPWGGGRMRARPPGRVGARMGRGERPAAEPDRRLAGQALTGGTRPACRSRGRGPGGERAAVRSVLLRRQARLAARTRGRGSRGPRARHPSHGDRRLVPLRPPRRRLRHRPLDRLAHPASADRRPRQLRPGAVRDLRRPAGGAARDPRDRGRARHPGPPELADRACALRSDRRPAGRPCRGRRRRARPGQGHLRDRRLRPCPRRRGGPRALRWPAADGRLDDRRPDRVRARRRRLRRRGDARVALPRARTRRCSPPRSARWRARPTTPAARGCCPGLAGIGAPWWRPDARAVLAGISGGHDAERRWRARRSRASPGGSPTSSRRSARASRSTACASTAGSPTSR